MNTKVRTSLLWKLFVVAVLAVFSLPAAEHHGMVKFGDLPVPGATVTATQGDKKFVTITDQQGIYSFPNLPDGTWKIRVEMLCFSPVEQDVAVAPDAASPVWQLKLLPFDQIKASAPPPAPTPAPTASTASAAAAPATEASAKPPESAKGKRKGSKSDKNAAAKTAPDQAGFQRASLNASSDAGKDEGGTPSIGETNEQPSEGFLINGSVNNGASSPFAQSAAFGNNRRNGRKLYNGNLGVALDNSVLDAMNYSITGQNTPKPAYNRFMGMASFGGPLQIPHVWNVGNAPNFFVNYQWMRNRNASIDPGFMPTPAERAGDLSQALNAQGKPVQMFDPKTGLPFPGNVIPASRISPQATALLGLYPLPNFSATARYNYQVPIVGVTSADNLQSRINKTIGRNNQVYGNFAISRLSVETPNLFGFRDSTARQGINAGANLGHRFNNHLFTTLGFNFSRYANRVTPYFANRANIAGEAGITGNNQESVNWGPPSLTFASGISALSDANYSDTRNQTSAVSADTFWNHGGHNIRFGGDLRRQQFNYLSQQNPRGSFTFTGAAAGSDFAGFLLGIPDTASIAFGNADKYFRGSFDDLYINDDWRVGPGLTLNIGLRWEFTSPMSELYGRLVNLDILPGFAAEAPVVASNPTGSLTGQRYPASLLRTNWHEFEPRIGFAWHPILASSVVVRGGYGIYYDTSVYGTLALAMAQQYPLSKTLAVQNSAANPLTLANGFIASPTITPNTFAMDPNFSPGYAQNWQLSVQSDLPGSLVATATYLGIKGTRARQEFYPNTYPVGFANPCPTCPAGFAYLASNGNSTRQAAQFQLRRRLHSGVTATLEYTFAKAIDDGAVGGKPGGQGASNYMPNLVAQNWLDLAGERGLSTFDQRHLVSAQFQYSTGVGLAGGGLMGGWRGRLLKEWTVGMVLTAGSGMPLTPIYLAAVQGTGQTGSIRPDYTGAPLYAAPAGLALNPAAYVAPAAGYWGNAGRNSITGPSQFSLNGSFGRSFQLTDRKSLDFRFDAVNVLNHVTFPSWNTVVNNAQFGLPPGANGMRTLQANLRLRF